MFKTHEEVAGDLDVSKIKHFIFNGLNTEKRAIFNEALFSRKDWMDQAFDIIEGSNDETIQSFVSEKMVRTFQNDLGKIHQVDITKNLKT